MKRFKNKSLEELNSFMVDNWYQGTDEIVRILKEYFDDDGDKIAIFMCGFKTAIKLYQENKKSTGIVEMKE